LISPLVGDRNPSHSIQQSRFTATRGAEQANEFSIAHLKINVIENVRALAVTFENHTDVLDRKLGRDRGRH
jgi:hypothetical protein